MKDHTLNELLEILDPYINDGTINCKYGKLNGDDFLILESWDDHAYITGLLNGFIGLKSHFGPFKPNQTLADEKIEVLNKLQLEPNSYYLKKELKAIDSVILYKQYLHTNNIEDPRSIDDFTDWGFSDEYDQCCNGCNGCENILRTSPDSYSWTAPLYIDAEGYACEECIDRGDYNDYILKEHKNCNKSIPHEFDLERLGLTKANVQSFENGLHGGQLDRPEPIIEALNKQSIDVWFIVHPSQFYVEFDVYVKKEDQERAIEILTNFDARQGNDPAEMLKKALQNAPIVSQPSNGVAITSINLTDGTAETKIVSKEDFIKGIK